MRFVVDKVKDCYAIANRRDQTCAIWTEAQISFAVYCAKKIGELRIAHVSKRERGNDTEWRESRHEP